MAIFLPLGLCAAADLPGVLPASAPSAETAKAQSILQIMKRSIRSKEIKEFSYDQVLRWKNGRQEKLDGIQYRTGLVTYRAETIFGVKDIGAKAYIRNNKVLKWVWVKSGMQIL